MNGEISSSAGRITASVVRGIDYWVSKTFCFVSFSFSFSSQHFMHWLFHVLLNSKNILLTLTTIYIYIFSMHTNTHSTHIPLTQKIRLLFTNVMPCVLTVVEYTIFDIWYFYGISANEWMVCEWFHCNEGRKSLKFLEKGCTISYISADEKNERFSQRDRKFQFGKFGWNSRFTDVMNGPYYYFFGIHILYNEFD